MRSLSFPGRYRISVVAAKPSSIQVDAQILRACFPTGLLGDNTTLVKQHNLGTQYATREDSIREDHPRILYAGSVRAKPCACLSLDTLENHASDFIEKGFYNSRRN